MFFRVYGTKNLVLEVYNSQMFIMLIKVIYTTRCSSDILTPYEVVPGISSSNNVKIQIIPLALIFEEITPSDQLK